MTCRVKCQHCRHTGPIAAFHTNDPDYLGLLQCPKCNSRLITELEPPRKTPVKSA